MFNMLLVWSIFPFFPSFDSTSVKTGINVVPNELVINAVIKLVAVNATKMHQFPYQHRI